jgi:hypothetical protein
MNEINHDDLTPAEREEFEKLPMEKIPSRILEERTVRALKDRGLIRSATGRMARLQPWMAAAAVAASVALFVSGMLIGQMMGTKQTVDTLAAIYPDATQRAAAMVQATGSEHAAALERLVDAASSDPGQREMAREVALAAFWAAAEEIVRLAPDDPLAARILQEFGRGEETEASQDETRNVVWF